MLADTSGKSPDRTAHFCRGGGYKQSNSALLAKWTKHRAVDIRHGPGSLTYMLGHREADGGHQIAMYDGKQLKWAKQARGKQWHEPRGLAIDAIGNTLIVGRVSGAHEKSLGSADSRDTSGKQLFSTQNLLEQYTPRLKRLLLLGERLYP